MDCAQNRICGRRLRRRFCVALAPAPTTASSMIPRMTLQAKRRANSFRTVGQTFLSARGARRGRHSRRSESPWRPVCQRRHARTPPHGALKWLLIRTLAPISVDQCSLKSIPLLCGPAPLRETSIHIVCGRLHESLQGANIAFARHRRAAARELIRARGAHGNQAHEILEPRSGCVGPVSFSPSLCLISER